MSITTSAEAPVHRSEPLRGRARELRTLARTTRVGRLASTGLLALVLVLLAGVLGLVAVLRTDAASAAVVGRAGPLTSAAQELYRALSSADAAAARGFLAGANEPAALREQYQTDITRAGAALAITRGGEGDDAAVTTGPAQVLSTGLPVYTGLVETARTADRQGLPVGGAYLREASSYMQTALLPAAEQIYGVQAASLEHEQDVADGGVWTLLALVALVAALVAVALLHRRIVRTTRRRVTPGVLFAAGALVLMLLWGAAALVTTSVLVDHARDDGTTPNGYAVTSRFALLQAQSDDILGLVARSENEAYEREYTRRSIEFLGYEGSLQRAEETGAAPGDLRDARDAAYASIITHNRVRSLDAVGNYEEAVALALSTAPASTDVRSGDTEGGAASVTRTEDALGRAIDTTAATAAGDAAAARGATTALAIGVVVLTIAALVGVGQGLWPRLAEYR